MNNDMNHVVMFSGGVGSWSAAKRVVERHGTENLYLLFTDTLIEDEDLYRFLVESAANVYGIDHRREDIASIAYMADTMPKVEDSDSRNIDSRKEHIFKMRDLAVQVMPRLAWIAEGRTPWEVYFDVRFLGNSRIDPCSKILKRDLADKWIEENFEPEEVICYIGIDWSEIHRYDRLAPRKLPYIYKAPMSEEPYVNKSEMLEHLNSEGIETPRLYKMGFSHNNCGGFCCKAGQGHFRTLLSEMPERFEYHESLELEIAEYLEKDVAMMKKTKDGVSRPLTLQDLRIEYEAGGNQLDLLDVGGCGCFLDDTDEVNEVVKNDTSCST